MRDPNNPPGTPDACLIDLIEEAVILAGRDGAVREWNAGATRMFGWTPDEAIGAELHSLGAGEGIAGAAARVSGDGVRWSGEISFLRKGGEEGVCEAVVLRLGDGRTLLSLRDNTRRRAFEARVADERRLLRTVIDAIPGGIFFKDTAGRMVLRNRANRELSGLEDDEVLGRTVLEMPYPPELAARYHADDLAVLASGEALINREEPYVQRSGRAGWFLTSKFPIRDAEGVVVGLVGFSQDITEKRLAGEALDAARSQLASHLDNSLLVVIELDAARRITRWAGLAPQVFGWEEAEVLGCTPEDAGIVHPKAREQIAGVFDRLIRGEETHNTSQNLNLTKDGRTLSCVWFNSVIRDARGEIRSFLMMAQDVSAETAAVEKLRDSDRLLHTLIDATNTGYFLLDASGCIASGNGKYLSFLGLRDAGDLPGRYLIEFIPGEKHGQFRDLLAALLADGTVRNAEVDFIGGDGRVEPFELNANVERTGTGLRIHVFVQDISLRRRALEERHLIERKMLETQKLESLGILAGGIAHDFNNLLTGILGNAGLASAILGTGSPIQSHLDQIEAASMRAADLCRQMLAYAGQGRFIVARHDLNSVIRDTTKLLHHSISKRAQLVFHLGEQLPPVMADVSQLRQIIMNLVINASEALGDRDGEITVSSGGIHATAAYLAAFHTAPDPKPGEYVWFEVADSGCGMSPEVQAKIFDPFFTTKFAGRGLGLAAVLGIVRGHRGAMKVASEPGQGTRFRILLTAESGAAPQPETPSMILRRLRAEGRVLVVDDEETVRIATSRMIEGLGFKVSTASDGRDAVEKFTAHPDTRLVLLDFTMPRMDGAEAFAELRKLNPNVCVVLMSGFPEQDVMKRVKAPGIAGFIQKPFSVAQLVEKLTAVLR